MAAAIGVFVLLVFAAVLLVPVGLRSACAVGEREVWAWAEVGWGRRLLAFRWGSDEGARVYILGASVWRGTLASLRDRGWRRRKTKKKRPRVQQVRELGQRLQGDLRTVKRMAGRALRALHGRLYVGGTVGLGDPADTALMLAGVGYLKRSTAPAFEIDLHDDYLEDTTQLYGRMRAWIVPGELVLILVQWLAASDTRRVLLFR